MQQKKKSNQKATEGIEVLDVYEKWLAKQKARPVRAKPGFISAEKTQSSA